MVQLLKDLAGPIATIIAAAAALSVTWYFAWHQRNLTKGKIRLDLFDRRMAIFSSIFDFYDAMISWCGSHEQMAARTRFFRAYQESKFLFKKDSRIEEMLKTLHEEGIKVIGFKEHSENFKPDRDLYLKLFNETQNIQVNTFPDGLEKLKVAMSEYLDFHDL